MGEVYKARDTRLDRTVAIKVLADSLAADPQFRERFDREARAISQLTHAHICTLHDVGELQGTAYLVMEHLDGGTLADRLAKGPMPLDQALRTAIELASALETAHRAGVIHRDLKPGNVILTKSGAKLLDFGLAKNRSAVVNAVGQSMLPTTPANLTAQGTVLGTVHYMAPEQLEGQEADERSDLGANRPTGSCLTRPITRTLPIGRRTADSCSTRFRAPRPAWISGHSPPSGDRTPIAVAQTPANDLRGRFSPNGRWVAYESSESGRAEIYLQSFPDRIRKVQVSTNGGAAPVWRSDGSELFFRSPGGQMMAASISPDGTPVDAEASALFTLPAGPGREGTAWPYAVSRDGKRFLVNAFVEGASPITVLLNWKPKD